MCSNPITNTRASRSLLDFETNEQLREALQEAAQEKSTVATMYSSDGGSASVCLLDPQADWVLNGYDPESTQTQTLEQEYRRLLTLKSYDLLDISNDKTLERITAMTGRLLKCPIAYVGTMDLGRYNILAGKGLGTLKNVHRKGSFCEHVVQSTRDIVVFEDASKNPFMKDSWFVNDGPKTKFYAAAKLVSPGGYVLGTLCAIDPKARPGGLSLADKQSLMDLADMVVDYMVERRKGQLPESSPAQQVASAAHDLITPLMGIDLVLATLEDDSNLTDQQRDQLVGATRCCSVVKDICRELLNSSSEGNMKTCCDGSEDSNDRSYDKIADEDSSIVRIDELVQKISTVMEHHPKQVPLVFVVDPALPNVIVGHDLMLFRSTLNLLTRACRTTVKGSFQLRLSQENDVSGRPVVVFRCQDTGPGIPLEEYPKLFQRPDEFTTLPMSMANGQLELYSVAQNITHMGGCYGYQPPTQLNEGSLFWFQVPLFLPETMIPSTKVLAADGSQDQPSVFPSLASEMRRNAFGARSGSSGFLQEERAKTALVIEDTLVIRKALSRCLTKLGFEVTQAENGLFGLKKLKEAVYDLVLCDFLMPVLDGVDCVEQFRAWEAKHRPAVCQQYIVGISAHCQSNDIQLGLDAGMNDFLSKPVTMNTLTALKESPAVVESGRKLDRIVSEQADPWFNDDEDAESSLPMFNCLFGAESNSDYIQLVETLNPKKWKVVTVHDGFDALELLKIQNWDLVILDEELPRLSGTRCAKRFREWEKCHRINRQRNMVLASAYSTGSSEEKGTKVLLPFGFEHLMEKPYRIDACRRFLHSVEENYTTILSGLDIIAH